VVKVPRRHMLHRGGLATRMIFYTLYHVTEIYCKLY
jgi:hypothetical protein